ncbi:SDR family NAD(P)-dependent oxidoreductase [Fructilactobacillus sp. Tb1]|uniref:SDR family NAD(P)-dependent oxidoreductase n=1 Tax=Fructilactobacillus sp. Tb1 TaxID=3422304 RepID=UPI003D2D9E1F
MNQYVVIIGVGPGFGLSIARRFAKAGKTPIMVARKENALKGFQATLKAENLPSEYMIGDVTKFANIEQVLKDIQAKFGVPETLVYNVGIKKLDTPFSETMDQIELTYAANVFGAINATRSYVNMIADKSQPHNVLVTGGGAAFAPQAGNVTLSATKAALHNYVFSLADSLQATNVYVGLITIQALANSSAEMAPDNVAKLYVQATEDRNAKEIKFPKIATDF